MFPSDVRDGVGHIWVLTEILTQLEPSPNRHATAGFVNCTVIAKHLQGIIDSCARKDVDRGGCVLAL